MKLKELLKEMVGAGAVDSGDDIEKVLPDLEATLDKIDVLAKDGIDWDELDDILGDVLPDLMKGVRKNLVGRTGADMKAAVQNMVWLLWCHYKIDVPWVPRFIEKKIVFKMVSFACTAVRKDQKDPTTDTTADSDEDDSDEPRGDE